MSVETRGSSAPAVSATHEPNDMPAGPQRHVWIARAHEVERGTEIVPLARPFVERARAPAGAAEVEPQHRTADAAQRLRAPDTRPSCASCRRYVGVRVREHDRRAQSARASLADEPVVAHAAHVGRLVEQASRRPAGPGISRSGIAKTFDELSEQRGELVRPRHRAEMAGRSAARRVARAESAARIPRTPRPGRRDRGALRR